MVDQPGAQTIIHKYKVSGKDTDRVRELELSSSKPKMLQIMGPSKRKGKAGDELNIKLMFVNRGVLQSNLMG